MPFGIIQVREGSGFHGTELLVRDEQTGITVSSETHHLKRVVHKVKLFQAAGEEELTGL
jgi:hypothetical protein